MVGLGISKRTTSGGNGLAPAEAAGIRVALVVAGQDDAAQRADPEGRAAGRAWREQ